MFNFGSHTEVGGWCIHRLGWLRTSRNAVNPSLEAPKKTSCFLRSWKSLSSQTFVDSSLAGWTSIQHERHNVSARRTPYQLIRKTRHD